MNMNYFLGFKKLRNTDHHTSTYGLKDQNNTKTKNYLTTLLDSREQKNHWDLLLNLLYYAYNSSVHTSTGYLPAELFFWWKTSNTDRCFAWIQ